MNTVYGMRLEALDDDTLATATHSLVERLHGQLADADRFAILPDAHYPYHPSTGMVTNPAVVDALAAALAEYGTDSAVDVILPRSGPIDPSRVATMLGYDQLASSEYLDVRTSDPPDTLDGGVDSASSESPSAVEGPLVEDVLVDGAVVVVPSLRYDYETGFAGAQATVARAIGGTPTRAEDVQLARRIVNPVATVIDATYVFTGEPYRASTLLASDSLIAADGAIATVFARDGADDSTVSPNAEDAAGDHVDVEGLDLASLRAELPDGEPPTDDGPGRIVREGYKLYTMVSGDVYPPHFRTQ